MLKWLVIAGVVGLVAALFALRRRLLDDSGPGRVADRLPQEPWDGRKRRSSDRRDDGGSR